MDRSHHSNRQQPMEILDHTKQSVERSHHSNKDHGSIRSNRDHGSTRTNKDQGSTRSNSIHEPTDPIEIMTPAYQIEIIVPTGLTSQLKYHLLPYPSKRRNIWLCPAKKLSIKSYTSIKELPMNEVADKFKDSENVNAASTIQSTRSYHPAIDQCHTYAKYSYWLKNIFHIK
jgi:hypothetical protein